jgi:hypothetical protein
MSKKEFLKKNTKPGEIYAGLILGRKGEPDYHLFLLPDTTPALDWESAIKWAESVGGELPTRQEQALLFANAKEHFDPNWYWSKEQHEHNGVYAWMQYFDDGSQDYGRKSNEYRARAVRRLIIE